ncbi:MAG: hypothetical protein AAF329_05875 [Cyanobacteria bacterium P01_A01_bin.17]
MTRVEILPIPSQTGEASYRAIAGDQRTEGRTVGEALDALTRQLDKDEDSTLIIVQSQRPDRFFSAEQKHRLAELMEKWRSARDQGTQLSVQEQSELDALVETELRASAERAASLVDELQI